MGAFYMNGTRQLQPIRTMSPSVECSSGRLAQTPGTVAILDKDGLLTYEQLNAEANKLARYLCRLGVTAGGNVVTQMDRSRELLIAQLAVLKCGAAYVPIDPEWPAERRQHLIGECRAQFVLGWGDPEESDQPGVHWIDCDAEASRIAAESATNLDVEVTGSAAAYVMYTSGSTGWPKGVVIPHRGVTRLAINNGFLQVDTSDCFVHHSNPAFDASTFEVWGALLNGAKVLIVSEALVLQPARFAEQLTRERASVLWLSVGLFGQAAEGLVDVFPKLRCLIVGGDALDATTMRRALLGREPERVLNGYGPTEGTTFSTTHHIEVAALVDEPVPIGRPIANARTYVLDPLKRPVPVGVTGELHIGGDGLALGYLESPRSDGRAVYPETRSVCRAESDCTPAAILRAGDRIVALSIWVETIDR